MCNTPTDKELEAFAIEEQFLVFFAAEPTDDEMRAVHDTLAAAPTAKAAPRQEAQEPVAFKCLHEWDGLARTSMPPKYACKHCHNFFDAPPPPAPQPAPMPLSAREETAMIDAAMVEMANIVPPLKRSECARLIHATLAAQGENT